MGHGEGANNPASVPFSALMDEAHLDLICENGLRGRPLANATEAELMAVLKREVGVFNERPCPGGCWDAVEGADRMDSS